MSEAPVLRPNTQILDEASAWFVEFNEGEVSVQSREAFAVWLKASPEHVRAFLAVSATFDDLGHLGDSCTCNPQALIDRILAEGNVVPLGSRETPAPTNFHAVSGVSSNGTATDFAAEGGLKRRRRGRQWLAAAAAVVLAFLGAALWHFSPAGMYSTGIGEQRLVKLADGSIIELNAESRVHVSLGNYQRRVDLLEGQALFRVAKDPKRPFIVRSDTTSVRAVGTQFDVNRHVADTVVTVLEGRVAIAGGANLAKETETPLYLSAGEQVIVTAQVASKPAHPNVAAATAWRERKLIFSSSSLPDVAREYNRYHEKRLVVADPALAEFRISGVFSASDSTSLIAFLHAQSNIDVEERDTEIVLKSR